MTDPPTLVGRPADASRYGAAEAAGNAADEWLTHEFVGVRPPSSLVFALSRFEGAWLVEVRRAGSVVGWLRG